MFLNIEIGCHLSAVIIVLIILLFVHFAIRNILNYFISSRKEVNRQREKDESNKMANSRIEKQYELDKMKLENSKSEKLDYDKIQKQLDLIEVKLNSLSCTNSK